MRENLKLGNHTIISEEAVIGDDVFVGHNCIIEENVIIADGVYIDSNTIIRSGTAIGKDSFIGANCILGEYQMDFCRDRKFHEHKLTIGNNALIRSGSILYTGSEIGNHFQTGHQVNVRENAVVGNHVSFGTLSDIQGDCQIGDYVRAHSNVHIAQHTKIDNFVWLFPYVLFTNDPTPPSEDLVGAHVCSFAVIASRALILPGKVIGQDSLVSAGSTVNKNVEAYSIVSGNPAKKISDIRMINHVVGKEMYPWRNSFKRGMPWEEMGFEIWKNSLLEEDRKKYQLDDLEL